MKTENTTEKPTLESLGLKCTVTACGVKSMNDDENPMCAWVATFTSKRGHSENFDYFTGSGCGVKWPKSAGSGALYDFETQRVLDMAEHQRHMIKDKALLCRIAHRFNLKAKWTPDPVEILWAIARDGDALQSTFKDWCSDLGYETDSRKAEKIYRACQDNALRLRKILSADKIQEIAQLDF